MTSMTVSHPDAILHGTIKLPGSKSISNRALILQQVSEIPIQLINLSIADDTIIMQQALQQGSGTIHLKNAGTCMRFLAAYFAAKEHADVTLLCDERMEQRPITELVDALNQLGADIEYINKEGFPPLRIHGKKLKGGTINTSASVSSQYISALMMIAPLCEEGLTINLTGTITSFPYIEMTARMMEQLGWILHINHRHSFSIHFPKQMQISNLEINLKSEISNPKSQISNLFIEPDWSAASYWYEMTALSKECNILLEGLQLDSLQGDAIVAKYMELFGVVTKQEQGSIRLSKKNQNLESRNKSEIQSPKSEILDLKSTPDLAPTLVVTAAALCIPMILTGLQNLVIKESNRLEALRTELTKLGFDVTIANGRFEVKENLRLKSEISNPKSQISTYSDHRIAMAFAPLALIFDSITIEQPEVVEKSYPHFWEDLKSVGFQLA
ncbi:MAG: 3-phosphoshikimate 1-carboxyvinyltransferase [Bacteroidota bacterium]